MASIYRPRYKRPDGSVARLATYRIAYRDEFGRRRVVPGFRDKAATQAKANALEKDVDRVRAGLQPTAPLPADKSLSEALDAYIAELERLGNSIQHTYGQRGFVRRSAEACGWKTLRMARRDTFTEHLAELSKAGRSPRTVNHHRAAMVAFLTFCLKQGWVAQNVLADVPKSKVGANRPRRRRAFTEDEWRRLCQDKQHGLLYAVAGLSGIRKQELRLMERRDVGQCQWRLRAEITKSKRLEVVPMLPECWELLQPLLKGKAATDQIFRTIPIPRTFDAALRRAGIAKRGEDGRQLDFHSLRYFFCTLTGKALPVQLVKRLMRHRDIRTTVNLYMDLGLEDVAEEVALLPRVLPANKNDGDQDANSW